MRFPESVGLLIDIVAVPSPTRQEENAARMLCDPPAALRLGDRRTSTARAPS